MRVLFSANLSFKQNRFTIKMKLYLVIFSLLAAAFSWIAFRAYIMLDLDKSKDLFNHKSCIRVSNFPGVEDITMFKNVAIGCTGNLGEVIEQNNPNAVPNGSLVLIDPAKQTVSPIEIKGFPQDIAFHPHGMSLFEDRLLYVINHAFRNGGERVDVFQVSESPKIEVTYVRSIQFPSSTITTLNDLLVVAED